MILIESSPQKAIPLLSCRGNSFQRPDKRADKISIESVGPQARGSQRSRFTFLTTSSSPTSWVSIGLAFKPAHSFAVSPPANPWYLCDDSEWAVDQDVGLDIDSINLGSPPAIIPVEKFSHTYSSSSKTNSVSEVSEVSVDTSRGRRVSMDSSSTEGSSIFVQQTFIHHSNSPFEPPPYFEEIHRNNSSVSAISTTSTFCSSFINNISSCYSSSIHDCQNDEKSTMAVPRRAKKRRKCT
mmetsp:Transcript_6847/g.13656  ORF Transcript_6847/g.13656 Transcript_6847/m.13656 type:complete len:239 (+) Transcript_6847:206-922(+)